MEGLPVVLLSVKFNQSQLVGTTFLKIDTFLKIFKKVKNINILSKSSLWKHEHT